MTEREPDGEQTAFCSFLRPLRAGTANVGPVFYLHSLYCRNEAVTCSEASTSLYILLSGRYLNVTFHELQQTVICLFLYTLSFVSPLRKTEKP